MNDIEVRSFIPDDTPFVIATWLNYYKYFSYFAKRIRKGVFFKWHHKIVENILKKPTTTVLIATPTNDPEIILGFLVTEKMDQDQVIHFIFVKEELRNMGIGRRLIEESKIDLDKVFFTHWTYSVNDLIKKYPNISYDPYRVGW